jgi:hypothetical protein
MKLSCEHGARFHTTRLGISLVPHTKVMIGQCRKQEKVTISQAELPTTLVLE